MSILGRRLAPHNRCLLAVLSLAAVALGAAPAPGQDATLEAPEIGTAVAVKRTVTAMLRDEKRALHQGARVHRTEYLETGAGAEAELRLDDQTRLALGPNASLRLDDFVIGQSEGVTTIAVNMVKGTFRFLTGSQNSKSYRIETPSATIGVRGTVFDVYIDGNGDTLVLLHEGEVDVCSKTKSCRRHNSVGRIVHTTVAGVVSLPIKFTTQLIPGLSSVGRAFPFVGRSLRIDPVKRLKTADIIEPVTKPVGLAVGGIKKGTESVGRAIRRTLPF
jgi:hypothetical protein